MYKLFLTLRYLTRKAIVIFPIMVVWLCVAMLIIVTSIMGGFVDRVKQVSRNVTGDIVIESSSGAGFPHYEEMQREIAKLEDVEISTPVVQAFGLVNTRGGNLKGMVMGIIPEERARVTRWRESLFFQYRAPNEAIEDLSKGGYPATGKQLQDRADKLVDQVNTEKTSLDAWKARMDAGLTVPGRGFNVAWLFLLIPAALVEWLLVALTRDAPRAWRWVWWVFPIVGILGALLASTLPMFPHRPGAADREYFADALQQWNIAQARTHRTAMFAYALPQESKYASQAELSADLLRPPSFSIHAQVFQPFERLPDPRLDPNAGVIISVDMATKRDQRGNYERPPEGWGMDGVMAIAPIVPNDRRGGTLLTGLNAQQASVRIIDDSYTGFFEIDRSAIYADFKMVQKLALMHETRNSEDGTVFPARVSAVELKLKGNATPERLADVREQVARIVEAVRSAHIGDFSHVQEMKVMTWDQRQKDYINAVANEKKLITFILLLMSVVVLIVVFLIFYIIVREKTRDIGIIKAIGGSELGVAGIFTIYGTVIGIIGGLAGAVTGIVFVRHTNEIHEWLYQTFGIMIWKRDVYLFDRIPDQYDSTEVLLYFGIAVVAGLLGALIPALVAGFQNPIRALRHE